jgi:hypothetical protein
MRIRIHNIGPVHKYRTDTLILVCGYWLDLDMEYCRRGPWLTQRKQTDQGEASNMQAIAAESFIGRFKDENILVLLVRYRIGWSPSSLLDPKFHKPDTKPSGSVPGQCQRIDPTLDSVQRDRNRSRAFKYSRVDLARCIEFIIQKQWV